MTTPPPETVDRATSVALASEQLLLAGCTGSPCAPVRELIGETDLDLAYAVQQQTTAIRLSAGARRSGHKIGLTSPEVQRQLGVGQPDSGALFADMDASGAEEIGRDGLIQPKVEAEVAFILGNDLTGVDLDDAEVRSCIAYAVAALEIVDSRIADWNICITDTIADNASSGRYVLGSQQVTLDHFDPRTVAMTLFQDEAMVSEGTGADCLGDPLAAVLWLARTAQRLGEPLRAGEVVLSGALGPMIAVPDRGGLFRAEISALGSVSTRFTAKEQL